jgi:hypothetical protein
VDVETMTEERPSAASAQQARTLFARNEARHKPDAWVIDPKTGVERQAAALLARPDRDDEPTPDKRSATERQAARMLDGRQIEREA